MKSLSSWENAARQILKNELMRTLNNYESLAILLNDKPENMRNKINRGTFSAAFFLEVLNALGTCSIDIDPSMIPRLKETT